MANDQERSFEAVVAGAAERLVAVRHDAAGSFVTTPMMYPGGGSVVVWVDRAPPHYSVSDLGFGFREAELMGADRRTFSRHAAGIVEEAGVELSSNLAFSVVVSEGQLEGAIKVIAGCAQEAAARIARRLAERQRVESAASLYMRLTDLFGRKAVEREIEFKGASQTSWQIAAAVRQDDQIGLFDPVTPHFLSVATTLAKFGDIRLLEAPPSRTAVLSSKEGFGTWITALSQTAHVVNVGAKDSAFQRVLQ